MINNTDIDRIDRPQRRFCKCECGKYVNPGKTFICGHNMRNENHPFYGKKGENSLFYGRELSSKTKRKISEALKGENNPFYGKKHSQEARRKISEVSKRLKHSLETRKKISESVKGEKHPNWRGGTTNDPYCHMFYDNEFKEMIFERDNYACQNPLCWRTSTNIMLHHTDYNKMNCDSRNVITLCNSCNVRANYNREYWQNYYTEIMKKPKNT